MSIKFDSAGTSGARLRLLADIKRGTAGKVVGILSKDRETLKKFSAMSIFPGIRIKVLQRSPSFLVQIGRSQFAMDKDLASQVQVEPLSF